MKKLSLVILCCSLFGLTSIASAASKKMDERHYHEKHTLHERQSHETARMTKRHSYENHERAQRHAAEKAEQDKMHSNQKAYHESGETAEMKKSRGALKPTGAGYHGRDTQKHRDNREHYLGVSAYQKNTLTKR